MEGTASTQTANLFLLEDLPGKWQAAVITAEKRRPQLRVVGSD